MRPTPCVIINPMLPKDTPQFKWISAIIIALLGFGIYCNTLGASFQFDDRDFITHNRNIQDITDVKAIWNSLGHPSRFVTFYTFALNYHFDKYNPFGYHLVNVLIHLANGLLVWIFSGQIIRLGTSNQKIKENAHIIALGVALFFVTHPLQTQAVSYVTQRFTALATLFYVMTLCLYIKARLDKNYYLFAAGIVTMVLGMFSKQITFTLPIMIIFIEFLFLREKLVSDLATKRWSMRDLTPIFLLPFCLLIPSFFNFDLSKTLGMTTPSGSHDYDIINAPKYFLTQFRVIPTYLKLLLIPINQNLDYDFPLSNSLFELKTLLGGLLLLSLFLYGIFSLKKDKLVGFGILWFFIAISVTSSIIPIHHVIFEHRMYLPMVGLSLAITTRMFDRINNTRVFMVFFVLIIAVLSVLTFQRNKVWQSEQSLWEDIITKSPAKAKPHSNLGTIYFENRRYDDALEMFNKAITFLPEYSRAYNNRAAVYIQMNKPELAIQDLNAALEMGLEQSEVYNNRGDAYEKQRKYDLALKDYQKAIELRPTNAKAHDNIGTILGGRSDHKGAIEKFNQAIAIRPDFADPYNNRGVIFLREKKYKEAIADLKKSLSLDKYNVQAYNNLGLAYLNQNDHNSAITYFQKALQYSPNYVAARNSLGIIYGKEGRLDLALKEFNTIKQINPNFMDAYNNAGLALRRLKRFDEAIAEYSSALQVNPKAASVYYNRSLCFFEMGKYEEALKDAEAAKRLKYPVADQYLQMIREKM